VNRDDQCAGRSLWDDPCDSPERSLNDPHAFASRCLRDSLEGKLSVAELPESPDLLVGYHKRLSMGILN
jgi:hypothetical protein